MIIGISKEELLDIDPWAYDNQQDLLNSILEKCKELDQWLPIDENTPKSKWLAFKLKDYSNTTGFCIAGKSTNQVACIDRDGYRIFPVSYIALP